MHYLAPLETSYWEYRMTAWTPRLGKPNCGRQCPDTCVLLADFVPVALRSADLDFVVLPAELLLHGLLPLREYAA